MADYLHGAYGTVQAVGTKVAAKSQNAIVYVGTAPVHTIAGGALNVNKPVLVQSIADARRLFGYSDDWAQYTLCEAMHAHLDLNGVGPLVLINVLDPTTHRKAEDEIKSLTPGNGRIEMMNAESIILDTVTVKTTATPPVTKIKGTDYAIAYDVARKTITIAELISGSLGTAALTITYREINATAVDNNDVIGSTDGTGLNKGIYAIKNVYQETCHIPSMLVVPGFSSVPDVHEAMCKNTINVNGHWNMYMRVDIPITDNGTAITLATADTWKNANGYNKPNETVYFPLAKGTDGRVYHLSVLAAANLQQLLVAQDDIPYKTPSNTECAIIQNLYLGAGVTGRAYDDSLINNTLNKNGIASAAYAGGRWVIWGCHSADYNQSDGTQINVSETNRMMLYHVSNDFQNRRTRNVDKPLTSNDIATIVAEEQTRLDALVKIGAITFGECRLNAEGIARSDVMNGDYLFAFSITTTPLAKSLTALVNWVEDGFEVYFSDLNVA